MSGKTLNEVAMEALAPGVGIQERSRRRDLSDIAARRGKMPRSTAH